MNLNHTKLSNGEIVTAIVGAFLFFIVVVGGGIALDRMHASHFRSAPGKSNTLTIVDDSWTNLSYGDLIITDTNLTVLSRYPLLFHGKDSNGFRVYRPQVP